MNDRPRLLDLFCGQGGAAMGYHQAGFEVVGVDNVPQPRYPFEFHEADALAWDDFDAFDAIHASPPCQAFTVYRNNREHVRQDHPDLIAATRKLLLSSGLPYIIENVPGSPLFMQVQLCGTSFGRPLRRHRVFESNVPLSGPPCAHGAFTERRFPGSSNRPNGRTVCNVGEYRVPLAVQRDVMQMPWADLYGLSQAVPPVYTEWLGQFLTAPSRLATEGRALPYMGRRRWGQEMTGSR